MKKTLLVLWMACWGNLSFAQLNMTLLDQLNYPQDLNDIWGWVDPDDGTEYALVGTVTGFSVVSLADPQNIQEVAFFPGDNSTWRDIKTWGNYAYVTADNGNNDGLLVVDLGGAPDNITASFWAPNLPGLGTYERSHNIYIDEFGYAYLAGSNLNNGGMLILDVFSTPGSPQFVVAAPAVYSHDVYVRNNIMYSSEIYAGHLGIYNVSNKSSIQLLATQATPFVFTHNSWLNDAGNVVFTTDEKANAPVAAYDISNLNDIVELDRFLPISTLGAGVIPHNVHVWQDWLIISYYTDGGIIVDASRPDNLIEVGNWDTFLGGDGGFSGAWGAYPFLPSGLVLLTDIGNGLFVCGADYVRACWLEGKVTNSVTGANIAGASVEIDSPQDNLANTSLTGQYKTGQAIAGTFDVTFSATGFISKTLPATLQNGMLTILDVELDPILSVAGETVEAVTGVAVPNAQVVFSNGQNTFTILSGPDGTFDLSGILPGTYNIIAGAWGYDYGQLPNVDLSAGTSPIVIELAPLDGYKDDFVLDFSWAATNTASTGLWERGEPVGTTYNGATSNPDLDVPNDLGDQCYVTGNGGGGAGDFDVDNGTVVLTSPPMNLAGFSKPILSYARWFFNNGGSGTPNDNLTVRITNGTDVVVLETISQSASAWANSQEFDLASLIPLTDNMQVIFEAGDFDPGHLVEAAVDAFLVRESCATPDVSFTYDAQDLEVSFTNTSAGGSSVEWDFGDNTFSNEENPVHTYAAPGEYEVTLSIANDCGLSVATQTVIITASGTKNLDEKAYSLVAAPNPFLGQVSVRYELKDAYREARLQVFDVLGKKVADTALGNGQGVVVFGDELRSGGVYFLRLMVDGQAGRAERIVKLSE